MGVNKSARLGSSNGLGPNLGGITGLGVGSSTPAPTGPINIIWDGNSIANQMAAQALEQLRYIYKDANFTFTNIAVNGQSLQDMVNRVPVQVAANYDPLAFRNIYLFIEIRNYLALGNTTGATFDKCIELAEDVIAAGFECHAITAPDSVDEGVDTETVNTSVLADASGKFTEVYDLHANGFDDYTSSNFDPDEIHLSSNGDINAMRYLHPVIQVAVPFPIPEESYTFTDSDAEAYSDAAYIITKSEKAAFDAFFISYKAAFAFASVKMMMIAAKTSVKAFCTNGNRVEGDFGCRIIGPMLCTDNGIEGDGSATAINLRDMVISDELSINNFTALGNFHDNISGGYLWGLQDSTTQRTEIIPRNVADNVQADMHNNSNGRAQTLDGSIVDSTGLWMQTRRAVDDAEVYHGSSSIVAIATTNTGTLPTSTAGVGVMCRISAGSTISLVDGTVNLFLLTNESFSDAKRDAFITMWNTFQTAMGR